MKFRKSISLVLTMCMLLSLFATFVVSAEEVASEEVTILGVDRVNNYDWTDKDFESDVYTPTAASAGEVLMAVSAEDKSVADMIGGNWFTWWYKILAKWDAENELYVIDVIDAPGSTAYEAWTFGVGEIVVMCNTGYASTEPAGNADDAAVVKALVVGDTLALNNTTWETLSVSSGALNGVYLTVNAPALEPIVPEEPEVPAYKEGLTIELGEYGMTHSSCVNVEDIEAGLTDGVKEGTGFGTAGNYLIGNSAANDATLHPEVNYIFNLGDVKTVEGVILTLYSEVVSMVGYPSQVATVYVSEDGVEWTAVESTNDIPLAVYDFDNTDNNTPAGAVTATITLAEVVATKYVKTVLQFPDSPFTVESGKYTEETAKPVWEWYGVTEIEVDLVVPSAEAVLPEGTGVTLPTGYGSIEVLGDGYTGVGEIDNYNPYQSYLFAFRNGTVDVESTYSITVDLDATIAFNTVTVYALSFINGNVGLPKAVSVTIGDKTYDAVVGSEDSAINAIVAELGETVEASDFTINVTMNSGAVKYNMYSEIEVSLVEVEEPELNEVDGGELPAHNPRNDGELTVSANTAITYTVAFENGANFNLYDETVTVLVNGEALEFGMLGYATVLANGDVVTIVNESAEAVELYPSISEIIFGTMSNPIVLEELGDITANVTEAILSDSGAVHYVYTATVNGTITVTMPEGDWTYTVNNLTAGVYGDTQWSDSDPVLSTYTIEVSEGDEIQIVVSTYNPEDMWAAPVGTVEFTVAEEEAKEPELNEVDGGELPAHNPRNDGELTVSANTAITYTVAFENGANFNLYDETVTVLVNGEALEFGMLGYATVLANGDVVTIVNESAEAVELYPSISEIIFGTMSNPIVLEELGDITANVTEAILSDSGAVHYVYTATVNGTITVTMPEGDWTYTVNNLTAGVYGDTQWSDSDPVLSTYTIEVSEGDEIQIVVSTYNPEDMWAAPVGTVEFTVTEEATKVIPAQPEELVDLPEGATALDILGYTHTAKNYIMYAEGEMTLGELTAKYFGTAKDLNYFKVIVVNEDGTVAAVYLTLGRPDGVKSDIVVNNQVVIALSGDPANNGRDAVADTVNVGDIVSIYNINPEGLFAITESTELTNAGFTVVAPEPEVVTSQVVENWNVSDWNNGINTYNAAYIFTDSEAYGEGFAWWYHVAFAPVGNGLFEVVEIALPGSAEATAGSLTIPEGGFVWTAWTSAETGSGAYALNIMKTLAVGNVVAFNGIDVENNTTTADATAALYDKLGDVNLDGQIDATDVIIIRKLVIGTADKADYTEQQLKLADVNGNGKIDANDFYVVKRHALGTFVIPGWEAEGSEAE